VHDVRVRQAEGEPRPPWGGRKGAARALDHRACAVVTRINYV